MYLLNFCSKTVQEKAQISDLGTCMGPELTMLEPHKEI